MTPEQKERKAEYNRKWRVDNKARKAYYDRQWRLDHPLYGREWYEKNKEKRTEYNRQLRISRAKENAEYSRTYKESHPDAVVAHNAINHGVFYGKITKPIECELCGGVGLIDGHHPRYDKPLEVAWLCRSCHNNLRAKEL